VSYYGSGVLEEPDLAPACPVLGHYGEKDAGIPVAGVRGFMAKHPALPFHIYPAGHGFNCDQRAAFDAPSSTLARERTLAFLRANLG
jgi:carboxymethylenebutenolidase